MRVKHNFAQIGSVLVLFALAIRGNALLWDFNKKGQENDWKEEGDEGNECGEKKRKVESMI